MSGSTRLSRDDFFMSQAYATARQATCSRLSVGAVIVVNGHIRSMGYNGAPSGVRHCVHIDDKPCRISVHAEANALLRAPEPLGDTFLALPVMYVTHAPCFECAKLIVNKGIAEVVYGERYRNDEGLDMLLEGHVKFRELD